MRLVAGAMPEPWLLGVVVEHGHRDVKTTLTVYAHLINTDDHSGNMAALGALATPQTYTGNVVPLHG
jgi:hypothetical protein